MAATELSQLMPIIVTPIPSNAKIVDMICKMMSAVCRVLDIIDKTGDEGRRGDEVQ